jgi:hypothetical protein
MQHIWSLTLERPESHDFAMRIVSHVENTNIRMQMIAEYQRTIERNSNFAIQARFNDAALPILVNDFLFIVVVL